MQLVVQIMMKVLNFTKVASLAFTVAMTLCCFCHSYSDYYYCVASGMVITATRMRSLEEDSLLGI